jgi:hypothetical protein
VEAHERDSEHTDDTQETRFLPPEPPGPEPELEGRPEPQAPAQQAQAQHAPAQQPHAQHAPAQQPHAPQHQTYGYPPPPGQHYYAPPPQGYYQPPPGYPPQNYAPQGYPPPGYPPPWGYPQPQVPDNGQAIAGFVFALVALGLLVMSGGLSSIVSIGCAIVGIVCGRNGKRKVDAGETPKHRGLAQAGFVIGWVSLVLSILATAGWILFIVLAATDEDFDWENSDSVRAALLVLRAGARALGG